MKLCTHHNLETENMNKDGGDATNSDNDKSLLTSTLQVQQESVPKMSKNRLKKLKKLERAQQAKADRKRKEREVKLAKAKLDGRDLEAEERFRIERTEAGDSKRRRQLQWETEKLPIIRSNFEICLDCSFEDKMTDREIASLASQIRYCYSYNKRAEFPCQFTVTSLSTTGRIYKHLQRETGFSEWKNRAFNSTEKHFMEHYTDDASSKVSQFDNSSEKKIEEKKELIYLTSDSDNIISELQSDKIYIIGGIVDRNRHKYITLKSADEYKISHGRLPLESCLAKMPSTKVLTCNHVFGILLGYRKHKNWTEALQDVLPTRKAAEYKDPSQT